MEAWTDYPFTWLGDTEGEEAPVREIEVMSYDGYKYCRIRVCGGEDEIKAGYIYQRKGRCGEVPPITRRQLELLKKTTGGMMAKYKISFKFRGERHDLIVDCWIDTLFGIWVNRSMKYAYRNDHKYWIPPHAIQDIEILEE